MNEISPALKAINFLRHVAQQEAPVTLANLSRAVGPPKPTAYHLEALAFSALRNGVSQNTRGLQAALELRAFRHSCGVELLRLSGGNLRAVQEHLRHADIQTTTVYTRLTQSDLRKVISGFDKNYGDGNRDSRPSPHGT